MKNKERATVFIPISNLDAIWKGNISKLPPNKIYNLTIDYPLGGHKIDFKIKTTSNGLGLVQLMKKIGNAYKKIYDNPEKYHVYGHDIDDLQLEGINVDHKNKTIELSIGS